jgi:hypothetical protein
MKKPTKVLYAGVLRAMGISIEPDVPDCAWIPIGSIIFGHNNPEIPDETTNQEHHMMTVNYSIKFTEPWRWIEISGTIDMGNI